MTDRREISAPSSCLHCFHAVGSLAEMKSLDLGDLKSNRSFDVREHGVHFHIGYTRSTNNVQTSNKWPQLPWAWPSPCPGLGAFGIEMEELWWLAYGLQSGGSGFVPLVTPGWRRG